MEVLDFINTSVLSLYNIRLSRISIRHQTCLKHNLFYVFPRSVFINEYKTHMQITNAWYSRITLNWGILIFQSHHSTPQELNWEEVVFASFQSQPSAVHELHLAVLVPSRYNLLQYTTNHLYFYTNSKLYLEIARLKLYHSVRQRHWLYLTLRGTIPYVRIYFTVPTLQ